MLSKEVRFLQQSNSQYTSELNQWFDYQVRWSILSICLPYFVLQGRKLASNNTEAHKEIS